MPRAGHLDALRASSPGEPEFGLAQILSLAIERFLARKAAAAEAEAEGKAAAAEAEAEARRRDYVSPLAAFTVPPQAILRSAFVT